MKFLLDQGLPRTTVDELRLIGIAAEHVGDIGLASASDMAILELAKTSGAIFVTLDADFHSLLAISNNSGPSVIRIRIEGLKGKDLARFLSMVSQTVKDELLAGAAVTVSAHRLALRRLPLVNKGETDESSEIDATS